MRFTDSGLLAIIVLALTLWLAYTRPRIAPENSWPLFYYLGLVVYQKAFPDLLAAGVVYGGVVCAMLIRFEFMADKVMKFIRVLETIVLAYVVWRMIAHILYWY